MLAVFAAAMVFISPPQKYVDAGLKTNPVMDIVPLSQVPQECVDLGDKAAIRYLGTAPGTLFGCHVSLGNIVVIPMEDTFPWDHNCYLMNLAHENAHAGGWPDTHPGGHNYVCHTR